MFVTHEMAGMGESSSKESASQVKKSGKVLLGELETIHITSHTGLTERRNLIRSWSTEELIRAHTTLHLRIVLTGLISYADRALLEAMEKEGTEEGGHHTGAIQISKTLKIQHGQGLTTTNNTGDTIAGFTRIAVWNLIKKS